MASFASGVQNSYKIKKKFRGLNILAKVPIIHMYSVSVVLVGARPFNQQLEVCCLEGALMDRTERLVSDLTLSCLPYSYSSFQTQATDRHALVLSDVSDKSKQWEFLPNLETQLSALRVYSVFSSAASKPFTTQAKLEKNKKMEALPELFKTQVCELLRYYYYFVK